MFDPLILSFLAFSFLLAGGVKGAAGMGLPTTAMGLSTLMVEPRLAVALILIPMITSNAWQVYRSGDTLRACRTYLPFAIALMVCVFVTVLLTSDAPDAVLFATLGGTLLVFVTVNLTRWRPRIPESQDSGYQTGAGIIAGIMGGLTSVWAPPLAVYLAAKDVTKDEFVRATGLLIFLGSVPLAIGYLSQGHMSAKVALISTLMILPTFAGFAIGENIRHRLSEQAFKKILLVLFTLMGLNLIRRAVMG